MLGHIDFLLPEPMFIQAVYSQFTPTIALSIGEHSEYGKALGIRGKTFDCQTGEDVESLVRLFRSGQRGGQ